MNDNWINIEGDLISFSATPNLLEELNIIPIFLRRYLERKYTKEIKATKEEQIKFQKIFLRRENIRDKEGLEKWLSNKGISESEMNKNLYNGLLLENSKKNPLVRKLRPCSLNEKHF